VDRGSLDVLVAGPASDGQPDGCQGTVAVDAHRGKDGGGFGGSGVAGPPVARRYADIEVLMRNGEIWTGYPTNVARNPL
jgi:hypothetical protein